MISSSLTQSGKLVHVSSHHCNLHCLHLCTSTKQNRSLVGKYLVVKSCSICRGGDWGLLSITTCSHVTRGTDSDQHTDAYESPIQLYDSVSPGGGWENSSCQQQCEISSQGVLLCSPCPASTVISIDLLRYLSLYSAFTWICMHI